MLHCAIDFFVWRWGRKNYRQQICWGLSDPKKKVARDVNAVSGHCATGRQAGSGGMLVQTASEILTRKQKPKCRKTTGKLFEGSKTWVWGKTFCRTWWKVSENLIKIAADVAVKGGRGRGREGEGLEEREGERVRARPTPWSMAATTTDCRN